MEALSVKGKLIIDGQIFQTPAWHRGMGKYSLELLGAINTHKSKEFKIDKMTIILSKNMEIEPDVVNYLRKRLKNIEIIFLDLMPNEIGNQDISRDNRTIIDEYISTINKNFKIYYLILSLMQGEISPVFPTNADIIKSVIIYDLIPLMFHDIYLRSSITRTEYLSKINELLRSDIYFTISKTVANDLATYIGVDSNRIYNINGGPIDHSTEMLEIDIPKPYILMPTGNDLRKNNRRAVLGFDNFNKNYNYKYNLVITSFFTQEQREELTGLVASNIVFTGNVSGEELAYLYDKSTLLLFPPEYEGLGLPILEALEYHKPVACSDISVFREMSDDFSYFDPYSIEEISKAIETIILKEHPNNDAYRKVAKKYTWENSAKALLHGFNISLDKLVNNTGDELVVFGPNPKDNNNGALIQSLHPTIAGQYAVQYVLHRSRISTENRINYLPYINRYKDAIKAMDVEMNGSITPVYFIDNTAQSTEALLVLLANPGVVVLLNNNLKDLWDLLLDLGLIDNNRHLSEIQLNSIVDSDSFLASIVHTQKSIIVFSEEDKKHIKKIAEKLNTSLQVINTGYPVAIRPYPNVLPSKSEIIYSNNDEALDYQKILKISQSKFVDIDKVDFMTVILAMSFGAIPTSSIQKHRIIPDNLIVGVEKLKSFKDEELASLSIEVLSYIDVNHSMKNFSERLTLILNSLDKA